MATVTFNFDDLPRIINGLAIHYGYVSVEENGPKAAFVENAWTKDLQGIILRAESRTAADTAEAAAVALGPPAVEIL
jgi:hypothetical protein